MFQSLIGKLKTKQQRGVCFQRQKFQSLIGKLKTLEPCDKYYYDDVVFQSLIGKLKTVQQFFLEKTGQTLFQSLIGKLKTFPNLDLWALWICSFNPL